MLKTKVIKLALLLILFLGSKTQYGQNEINYPYSRFGIGEMMYSSIHPYNGSMGGVSYTVRKSNMINPFNPASYTGIDTCSFVFDIGFLGEFVTLKDNINSVNSNRANISHVLFGFPLFKWWKTSIGLLPVSDINYKSTIYEDFDPVMGRKQLVFDGSGGLSKVYWGNAFQLLPNLSVGFNINFIFGSIYYSSAVLFPDSSAFVDSRIQQNVTIQRFTGDAGLQYFIPIKNKYRLGLGLTYSIPSNFNTNVSEYIYTFKSSGYTETFRDSVSFYKVNSPVKFPQSVGFGASFESGRTWFIGADITYTNWSNAVFLRKNNYLTDNFRFSLGGNYTPDALARNYFKRMSYRAGINYENGKYSIDGQNLNDLSVHVGFGFPFRKPGSAINLHLEYGKFGNTNNGLVQTNYFKIGISLSTRDIWFIKAKYD